MIGSLRGRLLDRHLDGLLVEVAGIGYRVTVGEATLRALGPIGSEVLLYVHHHVREDAETLYGFGSPVELRCFEAMLGANRVGPSLALAILGVAMSIVAPFGEPGAADSGEDAGSDAVGSGAKRESGAT